MRLVLLSLLYLCCSDQVFAEAVDGTQTLDCDATVQKQHRILLQHDQAHLSTVRSAIKNINDSLQGIAQREQYLTKNVFKSREVTSLLQDVVSKMKNNGANRGDEDRILAEKLENEITDFKSELLNLDFMLSALKIEEQANKMQLNQMQSQEKDLEISISRQEHIGPLENIETYLVAQLERSHEALELERQCCQFKLEATSKLMEETSKLMDSKLELVELKNKQICKTEDAYKNISEQLDIGAKEKTNLASENTQIPAELPEKSRQLDAALRTTTTTTAGPTAWTRPTGAVTLSTGTYLFNLELMNWNEARSFCRSKGMDLVSIESEAENAALSNHGNTLGFFRPWNPAWTSGCGTNNGFIWLSTGKPLSFTKWWPEYPKQKTEGHCIVFYPPDPRWWEFGTTNPCPAICEL